MDHSTWTRKALELRDHLRGLSTEERRQELRQLPRALQKKALTSGRILGREKQVEVLESDADTVLVLAGRGWGKNWTAAHWLLDRLEQGHVAAGVVGETAADVRDDIVEPAEEGAGLVEFAEQRELQPNYKRSEARVELVTQSGGARVQLYNGNTPRGLRGFSGSVAHMDELAKYRYAEQAWDQINLTLREGSEVGGSQLLVTTTPRPTPLIRRLVEDEDVHTISGSSWENAAHLDSRFKRRLEKLSGTRLGRQEVGAEVLEDAGDLWDYDDIDTVLPDQIPELTRVVIGLDPSISDGQGDEAGIVVVGLGEDGKAYVLADLSGQYTTREWGAITVGAYNGRLQETVEHYLDEPYSDDVQRVLDEGYRWRRADSIKAEVNQGGSLVESQLKSFDAMAAVNDTFTTQSKQSRAEPVHHLYQRGLVEHVGQLSDLEDQLCDFLTDQSDADSPDRADAAVYGISEVLLDDPAKLDPSHAIPRD